MSLKFNHIFLMLMTLSFLSAFVLPARFSELGREHLGSQFIETLFIPISRPSYHLSTWIRGQVEPAAVTEDHRAEDDVKAENDRLRQQVIQLQAQIESLKALAGEKKTLGQGESSYDRFTVSGTDSGSHEGLLLGGKLDGVAVNEPVAYSGGIAGKIDRVSIGSAHVRLITDKEYTQSAIFVRFVQTASGIEARRVSDLLPIVQGNGKGEMSITNLSMTDVVRAGLQAGDWLITDESLPVSARGLRIGKIASIEKSKAPLFAEIQLKPETGLLSLTSVFVMVRGN